MTKVCFLTDTGEALLKRMFFVPAETVIFVRLRKSDRLDHTGERDHVVHKLPIPDCFKFFSTINERAQK